MFNSYNKMYSKRAWVIKYIVRRTVDEQLEKKIKTLETLILGNRTASLLDYLKKTNNLLLRPASCIAQWTVGRRILTVKISNS